MKHQVLVIRRPSDGTNLIIPLDLIGVSLMKLRCRVCIQYGESGLFVIPTPSQEDTDALAEAISRRIVMGYSVVVTDLKESVEVKEYECISRPTRQTTMPLDPIVA